MRNADLLQELYDGQKYLEIVFANATPHKYMVRLLGRDKEPDCYISSFGANIWFRTVKGETKDKYKSYKIMLNAITQRAKQILGESVYIKEINIFHVKEGENLPIF